ncbi:MAG TPA: hypothetical protein VFS21_27590 [Roseiflexaceae bacterium]|nr:hypothetical protein [Roseiflexaceae bacterium]
MTQYLHRQRLMQALLFGIGVGLLVSILAAVFGIPLLWSAVLGVSIVLGIGIAGARFTSRHNPRLEAMELLPAIIAVAEGDNASRSQVETALARLEQHNIRLTVPVHALWAGQRDPAVLTAGLAEFERTLMQQALLLLDKPA